MRNLITMFVKIAPSLADQWPPGSAIGKARRRHRQINIWQGTTPPSAETRLADSLQSDDAHGHPKRDL